MLTDTREPIKRVKFDEQVSKIDAQLRLNKTHLVDDVFAFAFRPGHERSFETDNGQAIFCLY